MKHLSRIILLPLTLIVSGCVSAPKQALQTVPAGAYTLDKAHASLTFSVMHGGLSWSTMRFTDFDATLDFDTDTPENSRVTAIINANSIDAVHPTKDEFWDEELATDSKFLEADIFPQIIFSSSNVEPSDDTTAHVSGSLTLKGVTLPVEMDVTYNGSNTFPWSPGQTYIGFSATGRLNRSDFGMTALLPNAVGDTVKFQIEVEFKEAG